MNTTRIITTVVVAFVMCLPASADESSRKPFEGAPDAIRLQGVVSVVWGDPLPDRSDVSTEKFFLHSDSGVQIELALDDQILAAAGGIRRINGRRVEVVYSPTAGTDLKRSSHNAVTVRSLRVVNTPTAKATTSPSSEAVTGTQRWISILCKFSDVSSEPKALSYFQNMYSSSYPGLDYYWREISYDKANVAGSGAVAWVTLPHSVEHYASQSGGDTDALLADCTAAADSMVYFPDYVGINMMFNAEFGPYAWGGTARVNRDGVSRYYRVTWEPPWGWSNMGVIAHEMGHGFGLPHSNNADGDSSPYDNPWDVMSDSWNYVVYNSTYGKLGKGTIAYHRDMLGWIDAARKLDIDSAGIYNVTVDHLGLETTSNLRLVKVHIPNTNDYYTVEVRDLVSFDSNLPGFAVVIHEIDTGRREDAWLVDIENPSNGADEGAMWRVGECYEDLGAEISICVQSVATEGFNLRISYGETGAIFDDGFENGNLGQWSLP